MCMHVIIDCMAEKRSTDTIYLARNAKAVKIDTDVTDDETRVNRETTTLLWYDVGTEEANALFKEDIEVTRAMLRELNDFVQLFSNETTCIDYIEKFKSETMLLVVSGSSASTSLLKKVHALRQVDTVFIFCIDISKYEPLRDPSLKYSKIAGIFDEQQSLKESIVRTVRAIEKQAVMFSIYDPEKQKSNRNLNRESGSFVWFQLMKEGIQRLRANDVQKGEDITAKEEMLSKCRSYYRGNVKEMRQIDEFEHSYKPNEAISWYTRDSFVYKLINKALRTEDVEAIHIYRFYIADLCKCLAENFDILIDSAPLSTLKLYRGVKQTRKEIQRLLESIGQLISVNTFFSTSRNRSVAEMYAGLGSEKLASGDFESLIFEITVDIKSNNTHLADVSFYSPFKDEEEVLFDFAAVFEIEAVTLDSTGSFWICKMIASDKGRTIAKEYRELELEEIDKGDVVILLSTMLLRMSEFKKAKDYLLNLKDRTSTNTADFLHRLGYAHHGLDEHQEALEYFDHARIMYLNKEPPDFAAAAKVATHTGNAHAFLCQYNEALVCHTDSLTLYEKAGMKEQLPVVRTFIGLGMAHSGLGNEESSLQYYQQALSIAQRVVPFDHPSLGSAYMFVAEALYRLGDYDQALAHITNTVNIERHIFPSKSEHVATTLMHMGKYLYKQGNYDQALALNIEASEIFASNSSGRYPIDYANACNNIGKVHYRKKHYKKAMEFYDKALACLKVLMPNGHIDIAYTLKNQSELYLACDDLETATVHIQNARKSYLCVLCRGTFYVSFLF
jgi:tetratricopeptide (TPR) repeat protein